MSETSTELYDMTIIGGGPTGLFAAFYAGMRQAKTKIIESLPELGGQLQMLYPEKAIYDVAGFPKIKARELVDRLKEQVKPFEPAICLSEEVLQVNKLEDGTFHLMTNKGEHYSKTIIITAGNGAFQPRRLPLDKESELEGNSLHYYVNNPEIFRDKAVVVTGGGDSAVDWALMLEPIAKSVTLVHRRNAFRAHEHSLQQLENSSVQIKTPFIIEDVLHRDGQMEKIILCDPKKENQEEIAADELIVSYGFTSSLGPIKDWGLTIERKHIVVNSDLSTNIAGIYAAGDICTYPGKVNLIATGLGEAPTAVNNAMHFISPENRTQPMHSTSLFSESK